MAKDAADELAKRIAEGMAGWMSYVQACRHSRMYSEYLVYYPIFQLAEGRDWKVFPQHKIPKKYIGGRYPTVDFLFRKENIGVFLEVKFARYNMDHPISITNDIKKLIHLDTGCVAEKKPPNEMRRYILILGQEQNIRERIEKCARKIKELDIEKPQKLQKQEAIKLLSQIKNISKNKKCGWKVEGLGDDSWKHCAIMLKERNWWKELKAKNEKE